MLNTARHSRHMRHSLHAVCQKGFLVAGLLYFCYKLQLCSRLCRSKAYRSASQVCFNSHACPHCSHSCGCAHNVVLQIRRAVHSWRANGWGIASLGSPLPCPSPEQPSLPLMTEGITLVCVYSDEQDTQAQLNRPCFTGVHRN